MASLPTSLNIHQPNLSDGSDLLRMAALLSQVSSETANKAFTDFKSTMRTSANNDLAATFANGIASGLSPDEAFKQASGTINSWTSADAINSALQTRNAEKDAILRANQDRRAEAFENRAKLDWEGANKAAEANNLFNLAHATNNMNLFKQAEALTQGYDNIAKKHVKPTEMATLQDSLATNALNRAKLQAELDNTKQERLAKLAQARYLQLKANNPDKSTFMPLAQVAKEFGTTPEELQELGLYYGLTMGTETAQERQDTVTSSVKYTPSDAQKLNDYTKAAQQVTMNQDRANALLSLDEKMASEQNKQEQEALVNTLAGLLEGDSSLTDFGYNDTLEDVSFRLLHPFGKGVLPLHNASVSKERAKQFMLDYVKAGDIKSRNKLVDDLVNETYTTVSRDRARGYINESLNKMFKDLNANQLTLSDDTASGFIKSYNSQDLKGMPREERKNIYNLNKESLLLKKASAENQQNAIGAQNAYERGDYAEGNRLMKIFKNNNIVLQKQAQDLQIKQAIASSPDSVVALYMNYAPIIENKNSFDLPTLTKQFGEEEAKTMMTNYYKLTKYLADHPSLKIPDYAVKMALISKGRQKELWASELVKAATVFKGTTPSIVNSANIGKEAIPILDSWINRDTLSK